MHRTLMFSQLLLTACAGLASASDVVQLARIETGLAQGVPNQDGSVVSFKGIPYAAPPIGDLRWREPQPPVKWESVRKMDAFGASCPQPVNTLTPPYTAEFSVTTETSEDCLFLNVWTPAKSASEKLGVLVYIHGGSGTHGSGSVSVYDGEALARKGIVVVTINFRLGIFAGMGHPQLTAESPHHVCGNYGLLDMIAALKWIHSNIEVFGGDPEKVTIFGQSSGSMAAHYVSTSPLTKGLFRGLIAASFSYDYLTKQHAIGNVKQKEQQGLKFAAAKGVATVDQLRKISASELLANDKAVEPFTRACLSSTLVVDGWSILMEYPKALDEGLCTVPTLTGFTADDFGPPVKYLKTTVASYATTLPQVFGEKKDTFAAIKDAYLAQLPANTDQEARERVKQAQIEYRKFTVFYWAKWKTRTSKMPVYSYFFNQAIPWPQHPEFGAFHSSDLVYAFNNLNRMDRPWTEADRTVADMVSLYWANFVKTGNPNGDNLPHWPAFDAEIPSTMDLSPQAGPVPIAANERLEFYGNLFKH